MVVKIDCTQDVSGNPKSHRHLRLFFTPTNHTLTLGISDSVACFDATGLEAFPSRFLAHTPAHTHWYCLTTTLTNQNKHLLLVFRKQTSFRCQMSLQSVFKWASVIVYVCMYLCEYMYSIVYLNITIVILKLWYTYRCQSDDVCYTYRCLIQGSTKLSR